LSYEREHLAQALDLLEQAIDREPRYGPALALAAAYRGNVDNYDWADSRDEGENRRAAVDLAREALRAAADDPGVLGRAAMVLGRFGEDIDAALALIDRALVLNPRGQRGVRFAGWVLLIRQSSVRGCLGGAAHLPRRGFSVLSRISLAGSLLRAYRPPRRSAIHPQAADSTHPGRCADCEPTPPSGGWRAISFGLAPGGRRGGMSQSRRLAAMLREEGAEIAGCPTVAIVLQADPTPTLAWLGRFIAAPFDDLILLIGEGLYRLCDLTRPAGIEAAFLTALGRTRTICRGPEPVPALRMLGQQPQLRAQEPTTDGIIALLSGLDLRDRRVGVQIYPDAGDRRVAFLAGTGAVPDPVTPYEYASCAAEETMLALIDQLAVGGIDVIALTSAPQVRRLFHVAQSHGLTDRLRRIGPDDDRRNRPGCRRRGAAAMPLASDHAVRGRFYEAADVGDHRCMHAETS
jgi:uroporphyrinogen-III synthase